MSALHMDQFETGTVDERGQFDAAHAAWSWGKDFESGCFWAECIEYFDPDAPEFEQEYFTGKTLKTVLRAVRRATCSSWTEAVIAHDNGKKRTVKL